MLPGGSITLNGAAFSTAGTSGFATNPFFTLNNSTLNLLRSATLAGLVFNSSGSSGDIVNLNSSVGMTLTLPSDGSGITSTPTSVASGDIATINSSSSTNFLSLNGTAQTFTVRPTLINSVNVAPLQSGLTINAIITDGGGRGSIVLKGGGVLQLSAANTFSGGIDVQDGSSLIVAGSSTVTGGILASGPLGIGTLTLETGATLISSGVNTIANNVVFNGMNGVFTFNGASNLTLTGTITLPDALSIDVVNPGMTATLAGTILDGTTPGGSITITKSGLGTLVLNQSFTGTVNSGGGTLSFLTDGTPPLQGTGDPQIVTFDTTVNLSDPTTITVGRLGTSQAPLFTTASNKTVSLPNLTLNGNALSVNNLNGYGLLIPGNELLSGTQNFAVVTASASNVTQGLTITGTLSGVSDVIKTGAGTLVLAPGAGGNTFGGSGNEIDIQGGIVSVSADNALGDPSNRIVLDANALIGVGLRATGTFATSRTIVLDVPNNAIEVTAGNTLTLNTSFSLTAPGENLAKNDNGILVLNASNSTWTGTLTINAGAVQVTSPGALGGASVLVGNLTGAALQLVGNGTYTNALTLGIASSGLDTGLNFSGALENVSGNNTWSGAITYASGTAAEIGSDSGTLTISGSIIAAGGNSLYFGGSGNIILSATSNNSSQMSKLGSGTLTYANAPSSLYVNPIFIDGGTFILGAAGKLGAGTISIEPGTTLDLDNTGTIVANRMSTRNVTFVGGTFNDLVNAAGNSDTVGAPTFSRGLSTIDVIVPAGAANSTLTFGAQTGSVGIAQNAGSPTARRSFSRVITCFLPPPPPGGRSLPPPAPDSYLMGTPARLIS